MFICLHVFVCVYSDLLLLNDDTLSSLIEGRVSNFDKRVTIATLLLCFIDRVTVLMFLNEMWPVTFCE